MGTMRTRDRLRLLRALRRGRRRNKCDTTNSQEELPPNHLKTAPSTINCQLLIVLLKTNVSFSFFLGDLKLKNISISYIRDVCHHIKFSDAGVNWNPLDLKPNKR